MTEQSALKWALDNLKKLVVLDESGSAYIRGTGTELAGFAQKFHEAEELAGAAASASPQPCCPKCGHHTLAFSMSTCSVICDGCREPFMLKKREFLVPFSDFAQFFAPAPAQEPPKCEGCKTQSLDAFEHDGCLTDKVVDQEQARWQKALYDLSREHAIAPDEIDGSGCDSGDPLDLTLAEVGQVICQLENPEDYKPAPRSPWRIAAGRGHVPIASRETILTASIRIIPSPSPVEHPQGSRSGHLQNRKAPLRPQCPQSRKLTLSGYGPRCAR